MGDALGNLRLWDRIILSDPTKAHSEAIWSVAWSRDGRLACGSWDHSISIWKIETTSNGSMPLFLNRKEQAHDQWVRDVAWIDNEQTIASVGDDGNAQTPEELRSDRSCLGAKPYHDSLEAIV